MEQLCVHALLVQLYAKHLVAEGETPDLAGPGLPAAMSAGWRRRNHQRQLATGSLARPFTAGGSGVRTNGMGGAGAGGVREFCKGS